MGKTEILSKREIKWKVENNDKSEINKDKENAPKHNKKEIKEDKQSRHNLSLKKGKSWETPKKGKPGLFMCRCDIEMRASRMFREPVAEVFR